jgi:hypothetical protein
VTILIGCAVPASDAPPDDRRANVAIRLSKHGSPGVIARTTETFSLLLRILVDQGSLDGASGLYRVAPRGFIAAEGVDAGGGSEP